jgi:hypothetical protein
MFFGRLLGRFFPFLRPPFFPGITDDRTARGAAKPEAFPPTKSKLRCTAPTPSSKENLV